MMKLQLISTIIMPILFWTASYDGIGTVAAVWLANVALTIAPSTYVLLRRIQLPLVTYFKATLAAVVGSLSMAVLVLSIRLWLQATSIPAIVQLTTEVLAGVLCYVLVVLIVFRKRIQQYVQFARFLRGASAPKHPGGELIN